MAPVLQQRYREHYFESQLSYYEMVALWQRRFDPDQKTTFPRFPSYQEFDSVGGEWNSAVTRLTLAFSAPSVHLLTDIWRQHAVRNALAELH
jgi:hypothetical protein